MKTVDTKIEVTFSNILFWNNKLWFTEFNCNELYCFDLIRRKLELFCKLKEEKEYETYLFSQIIPYKDFLYLIPAAATSLYCINIKERKIKRILLDSEKVNFPPNIAKFVSAQVVKDKIYLIGASCPLIVIYNCINDEITYISEELFFLQENNFTDNSIYVRNTLLVEEKIYIPLCKKNYVGIFDISKKKIIYQEIGHRRCGYSSICGNNAHNFWLTPVDGGSIVYWEENTGRSKEIDFPLEYMSVNNSFSNSIFWKGTIWIFPLNFQGIWTINSKSNEMSLFEGISVNSNKIHAYQSEEKLFCFSETENLLYILDSKTDNIESIQVILPEPLALYHKNNNYKLKINSGFYQNEEYYNALSIIWEYQKTKLKYYILWINQNKDIKKGCYSKQVGQDIFKSLMKK